MSRVRDLAFGFLAYVLGSSRGGLRCRHRCTACPPRASGGVPFTRGDGIDQNRESSEIGGEVHVHVALDLRDVRVHASTCEAMRLMHRKNSTWSA